MAHIDGQHVQIRPDPNDHRMTFTAAKARNPQAFYASCLRGAAYARIANATRWKGRAAPDPIIDMTDTEFFVWLAEKESER